MDDRDCWVKEVFRSDARGHEDCGDPRNKWQSDMSFERRKFRFVVNLYKIIS